MKKLLLIICLLLCTLSFKGYAQAGPWLKIISNKDSTELKKMLLRAKTDSDKIKVLNTLMFVGNDPLFYCRQLIQINKKAKLLNDSPFRKYIQAMQNTSASRSIIIFQQAINGFDAQHIDQPQTVLILRVIFNQVGQQEEKYKYYSQKLSFYLQHPQIFPGDIASCYHAIAGYYYNKGDYNSSINYYLKAAGEFKLFSKIMYINDLLVAGSDYNEWGNQPKALYYLKLALKADTGNDTFHNKYFAMQSLATVEYSLKNYNASLNYLKFFDTIPVSRINIIVPAGMLESLKALNYIALNRLPEAIDLLHKAEQQGKANNTAIFNLNGYYEIDYGYYKYYLALHQPAKAIPYLLAAYQKAATSKSVTLRLKYLKELAYFYGGNNNTANAWKYTTVYNTLKDSLENNTNKYKIASYENEMLSNAQNKNVAYLKQESVLQSAAIGKRNMMIWFALAGLLLVGISLIFIYKQLQVNKKTLSTLQQTQTQLIQSEKMASLGELTAGIAHEIQNPLNFVNNFSEVNKEMLEELKAESEKPKAERDEQLEIELIDGVIENEKKISHHGKRADFIVKGMLQHSRTSTSEKQLTNINVLADEFLKLSYHGLRAKDKNFNAELITNFDESLHKVNIAAQDIGRVLLNLFNNAFYAVNEKQKTAGERYKPEVIVSTSAEKNNLVIKVKDNGNGIPDNIKDKIMQPFFTTKPTGEGTGLGLSLSYDIVIKGHGGTITVDTKEHEFTEFTITLPMI